MVWIEVDTPPRKGADFRQVLDHEKGAEQLNQLSLSTSLGLSTGLNTGSLSFGPGKGPAPHGRAAGAIRYDGPCGAVNAAAR